MRNASKHIYLFDHYRGLPRQDVDEEGLLLRVLFKIFDDDLVVEQVLGETRDVDLLVFALCDGLHRGKRLVGETECKPLVLAELWIRWRLLAALFLCQWKAGAHGVGLVEVSRWQNAKRLRHLTNTRGAAINMQRGRVGRMRWYSPGKSIHC